MAAIWYLECLGWFDMCSSNDSCLTHHWCYTMLRVMWRKTARARDIYIVHTALSSVSIRKIACIIISHAGGKV